MRRRARERGPDATEAEWAWLTASPDLNPFLGFHDTGTVTTWDRLQRLWDVHEAEIRAAWGDETPALPHGHPASPESDGGKVGDPWTLARRARWGR